MVLSSIDWLLLRLRIAKPVPRLRFSCCCRRRSSRASRLLSLSLVSFSSSRHLSSSCTCSSGETNSHAALHVARSESEYMK